jgi:hypothetical protein
MTTFMGDADIATMFADLSANGGAVSVVIGATTVLGVRDMVGRDVLQSLGVTGITGTTITVTCQTTALPALTPLMALTVDGANMRLRAFEPEGDGALTHLLCERAP